MYDIGINDVMKLTHDTLLKVNIVNHRLSLCAMFCFAGGVGATCVDNLRTTNTNEMWYITIFNNTLYNALFSYSKKSNYSSGFVSTYDHFVIIKFITMVKKSIFI